jgi:membrane-associated phospholipid phosphatase
MRIVVLILLVCPMCIYAQVEDSAAAADSPTVAAPAVAPPDASSADASDADISPPSSTPIVLTLPVDREASWLKLPGNILDDQHRIWLAPLKLKERKYWIPTAAILATAAGLVALDPKEGHYFRNSHEYDPFNNVFSGQNTGRALWLFPFALYGAGMIGKDSKMKSTALLAGEAVIDSEILTTILKDIDRRKRPMDFPANGNFADSWFDGRAGGLQGNGSFPSGHTIAAFSIATVIARRYANHKWVPYVAYGTAAIIGFSRLTLSSHYASDVFVGAVLGYSISRFSVLQQ